MNENKKLNNEFFKSIQGICDSKEMLEKRQARCSNFKEIVIFYKNMISTTDCIYANPITIKWFLYTLIRINVIPSKDTIFFIPRKKGSEIEVTLQDNYLWICRDLIPVILDIDFLEIDVFSTDHIRKLGEEKLPKNRSESPASMLIDKVDYKNACIFNLKYIKSLNCAHSVCFTKDELIDRAGVKQDSKGTISGGGHMWRSNNPHIVMEMLKKTAIRKALKYVPDKRGGNNVITVVDNASSRADEGKYMAAEKAAMSYELGVKDI